jgi:dienelactone hydrolase
MQHKIIFILIVIFSYSKIYAQQIGHITYTYIDSSRGNRAIETKIYYPATIAGNNTPVAPGTFPLIAFGHGFVMDWSAYQNFWELLVSEGYIVAFPTTEGSLSPSHGEFGKDLAYLIDQIRQQGAGAILPTSSIGIKSAIMGHSMGGGSSFLAAENNTSIQTMVTFASANTNPSAISASASVTVPTLLFSGLNDCVTPPVQHQDIMYDSTTAGFKTQINIKGGGHCFFANSNLSCSFGEGTCTPIPTISRAEQQSATNDFLKLWLAYYLKDDCPKAQEFQDSLIISSRINFRQSQSIACATGLQQIPNFKNVLKVYPNPFYGSIRIKLDNEPIHRIQVYNTTMQLVKDYNLTQSDNKANLDLFSLPNGVYFIKVNQRYISKISKAE